MKKHRPRSFLHDLRCRCCQRHKSWIWEWCVTEAFILYSGGNKEITIPGKQFAIHPRTGEIWGIFTTTGRILFTSYFGKRVFFGICFYIYCLQLDHYFSFCTRTVTFRTQTQKVGLYRTCPSWNKNWYKNCHNRCKSKFRRRHVWQNLLSDDLVCLLPYENFMVYFREQVNAS
jgi:hypothetical protein